MMLKIKSADGSWWLYDRLDRVKFGVADDLMLTEDVSESPRIPTEPPKEPRPHQLEWDVLYQTDLNPGFPRDALEYHQGFYKGVNVFNFGVYKYNGFLKFKPHVSTFMESSESKPFFETHYSNVDPSEKEKLLEDVYLRIEDFHKEHLAQTGRIEPESNTFRVESLSGEYYADLSWEAVPVDDDVFLMYHTEDCSVEAQSFVIPVVDEANTLNSGENDPKKILGYFPGFTQQVLIQHLRTAIQSSLDSLAKASEDEEVIHRAVNAMKEAGFEFAPEDEDLPECHFTSEDDLYILNDPTGTFKVKFRLLELRKKGFYQVHVSYVDGENQDAILRTASYINHQFNTSWGQSNKEDALDYICKYFEYVLISATDSRFSLRWYYPDDMDDENLPECKISEETKDMFKMSCPDGKYHLKAKVTTNQKGQYVLNYMYVPDLYYPLFQSFRNFINKNIPHNQIDALEFSKMMLRRVMVATDKDYEVYWTDTDEREPRVRHRDPNRNETQEPYLVDHRASPFYKSQKQREAALEDLDSLIQEELEDSDKPVISKPLLEELDCKLCEIDPNSANQIWRISAINHRNEEDVFYFNTEAYILNEDGKTIEKIR